MFIISSGANKRQKVVLKVLHRINKVDDVKDLDVCILKLTLLSKNTKKHLKQTGRFSTFSD